MPAKLRLRSQKEFLLATTHPACFTMFHVHEVIVVWRAEVQFFLRLVLQRGLPRALENSITNSHRTTSRASRKFPYIPLLATEPGHRSLGWRLVYVCKRGLGDNDMPMIDHGLCSLGLTSWPNCTAPQDAQLTPRGIILTIIPIYHTTEVQYLMLSFEFVLFDPHASKTSMRQLR